MDDTPSVEATAFPPPYTYTPPTWPPPSGGAPVTTPEMGPITNPTPYGSPQTATINANPPNPPAGYPPPFGSLKGTTYPQSVGTGRNGQNQGPSNQLPPLTRPWEVGPIAADPAISAIKPPPKMGPGPQNITPAMWEAGPLPGNPFPKSTLPAGSWLDGFSSTPL